MGANDVSSTRGRAPQIDGGRPVVAAEEHVNLAASITHAAIAGSAVVMPVSLVLWRDVGRGLSEKRSADCDVGDAVAIDVTYAQGRAPMVFAGDASYPSRSNAGRGRRQVYYLGQRSRSEYNVGAPNVLPGALIELVHPDHDIGDPITVDIAHVEPDAEATVLLRSVDDLDAVRRDAVHRTE